MALARKSTKKIYEIQAHTPKSVCLDIGDTGRVLVTGGQDRNIKLWTLGNDECFMVLEGHNASVDCVKFAHNDDYVYSADEAGIIKKWNLNTSQGESTFYGHIKSVRTLHFHPRGDYIVSGSQDTTLRLWDLRTNISIKKYVGHISHVNSVKFSPDGLWLASAGEEGSVIIWDVRMSKQVYEFTDSTSAKTCVEYHPTEFLLASGRSDGKVDFYDLDKMQVIETNGKRPCMGSAVRAIVFSENGECLFAGASGDIGVFGWEPEKEFDRVEGNWININDIKTLRNKLYVGTCDNQAVSIHAINLDAVVPFYNPEHIPLRNSHSVRKSFSNRGGKLRLSLGKVNKTIDESSSQAGSYGSNTTEGRASPNLSFEMVDDDGFVTEFDNQPMSLNDTYTFNNLQKNTNVERVRKYSANDFEYYNRDTSELDDYSLESQHIPSSHTLVNSSRPDPSDFPVNNAVPPDYAPKNSSSKFQPPVRAKVDSRRSMAVTSSSSSSNQHHSMSNKEKNLNLYPRRMNASVSSMELNKLDDNLNITVRRPISRGASPIRSNHSHQNNKATTARRTVENNNQSGRSGAGNDKDRNRNIPVHIVTSRPVRSKTNIDMKVSTSSHIPKPYISDIANEDHEIQLISTLHESVFQSLQNRNTSLQILRTIRTQDLPSFVRTATQMNNPSVLVDVMGVLTENGIPINLDVCVVLLPEIHQLLSGEYQFHYTRACDMLRTILTKLLPIIRDNCDNYGSSFGVDISREERQKKAIECKMWLLRIRSLTDNQRFGSQLTQLQNMIVDL